MSLFSHDTEFKRIDVKIKLRRIRKIIKKNLGL